jgi:UDP-GlcNAc:undecaprenyl-phosphate GlcNAc-1-phosphate transferase
MTHLHLLTAGIGLLMAFLVGHHATALGHILGLMDVPDGAGGRKLHRTITPLVGGLGIMLAVGASFVIAVPLLSPEDRPMAAGLMAGVTGMYLIGAMDDRVGLSVRARLGMVSVLLLALVVWNPAFRLDFLRFTGQSEYIALGAAGAVGFTLLCLVGLLNAVNMADGKNGLVIGQSLIWTVALAFRVGEPLQGFLAALGGALLLLFVYNMQGRLFLGDGGSYAISAAMGLVAIAAWNHGHRDFFVDDIALIFALPVFDTLRLMATRMLSRRSPFTPGRDHFHHYLYARWGWPAPLPAVLALVAIPNAGALLIPGTAPFWLALTFLGYVVLMAVARPRVPAALQ